MQTARQDYLLGIAHPLKPGPPISAYQNKRPGNKSSGLLNDEFAM
jgi:hypothetical protein